MSCFLRKTTQCVRSLGQTSNARFATTRCFSISSKDSLKHSFTVSYLMNSFGFSKNDALLASRHVSFDSREKADQTIEFFNRHGFTVPQIAAIVRSFPRILLYNTDQKISPKLEFLRAKGLSRPELASMIAKYPSFIRTSLANRIAPSYDFWRKVFESDEKVVSAMKRSPDLLTYNLENNVSPIIDSLRSHGTPMENIFRLAVIWPILLSRSPAEFEKAIEEVVGMGFDTSKTKFMTATVAILLGKRDSRWDMKVEAYKKWGWSEEEFSMAFKMDPNCMCLSLGNITASMEFYVAEMGLEPGQLAKWPTILSYGLKRAKLRCSVYRALLSKDLLKRSDVCLLTLVSCTENKFLEKYVTPYVKESPELWDLYKANSEAKTMP